MIVDYSPNFSRELSCTDVLLEAKREALIYARISGLKKYFVSSLMLPAGPSSPYSGERASRTTGSVTSFFHCNNHVTSNFHTARGIKA